MEERVSTGHDERKGRRRKQAVKLKGSGQDIKGQQGGEGGRQSNKLSAQDGRRQKGQEERKAVGERINRGWKNSDRPGEEEGSRRKSQQRMEEGRKVRRRRRQ